MPSRLGRQSRWCQRTINSSRHLQRSMNIESRRPSHFDVALPERCQEGFVVDGGVIHVKVRASEALHQIES
jgi:hypothetical protein